MNSSNIFLKQISKRAIILALLSFFLLNNSAVFAQDGFKAGASFGVIASQVAGDGYGGFDKAGLFGGLFVNTYTSEKVSWQMEINYAQKGARRNPKTSEGDHEFFLMRLNYIDVPLMVKVDYKSFTFEGGLYYGRLLNYHLENEDGEFSLAKGSKDFKEYEIGALFGITFHFTEQLLMNWRFNNSIREIREYDSGSSYMLNTGYFNTYLSFSLRYEFIK